MKEQNSTVQELLYFIDHAPSPYHVVDQAKKMLEAAGFERISEKKSWELQRGKSYYVTRQGSAIIAFRIPQEPWKGFHLAASHSDSPAFKIKANPEMTQGNLYTKLNVERYGGMILSTWFDRPLSVAGKVYMEENGAIQKKLVNFDRDLLVIPSLAIHMNREANNGVKFSVQKDLCPLLSTTADGEAFMKLLEQEAGADRSQILGYDLNLYTRQPGTLIGVDEDLILSPRLDDQECAFASLKALIESNPREYVSLCAVFDNEEVGSMSPQGADSDFLRDTVKRVIYSLGGSETSYMETMANSFMISADNAHAVHPNSPEKADPTNRPAMNAGIVIKYSAAQKYTTSAYTGSVMKQLCRQAGVPCQVFHNHSDSLGGGTLGKYSATHMSVATVDIGLAQLAMHSAVETAGSRDIEYLVRMMKSFYGM
ncbi:MAG: M18 family aminopeptidase [Lachnospiraceae bacterium]|nr:M18 family aminopeptidase [Lachnospiraceae bacterium]